MFIFLTSLLHIIIAHLELNILLPGPRMFYNNTQDLLMKKKLDEQAEFRKALDMQSRKLASLDMNNLPRRHPFSPNHNLSPSAAVISPTRHPLLSPNHMRLMCAFSQEAFEGTSAYFDFLYINIAVNKIWLVGLLILDALFAENVTAPTLSLPPHVLANRQMTLERFPNANNLNDYTTNNTSENGKLGDSAVNGR